MYFYHCLYHLSNQKRSHLFIKLPILLLIYIGFVLMISVGYTDPLLERIPLPGILGLCHRSSRTVRLCWGVDIWIGLLFLFLIVVLVYGPLDNFFIGFSELLLSLCLYVLLEILLKTCLCLYSL